jgi:hypothetical protein
LAWTDEQLAKWYGHTQSRLSEDERTVPEAARLALAGDAGQRALAAWHFAFEPAARISGKAWTVPVLAQLLDDPYAAVRCVAERALRQTGASVPDDYDYAVSPAARAPARAAIAASGTDTARILLEVQRLTDNRDDRRLRLRE